MNTLSKIAIGAAASMLAAQAMAQITLYAQEGLRGRAFSSSEAVRDFARVGFNDRASSVLVEHGRWEVCDDANFRGRCMVLRHGSYESLASMGMNNSISSARPLPHREHYENEAPEPLPEPSNAYRRRPQETLYDVPVVSAHAVVGPPEQRCWVERQQVNEPNRNVGGALAGALIGGVLGHQIGGGSGRDVATAGGALAGAAIGSNAGGGGNSYQRDVRRCDNVPNTAPEYWDVIYDFRGTEHHVQLRSAPGPTIVVNSAGEPRT